MTDVAAWLRGLGLGRYEAAFRDNDVGPDVVPRLTADDLKDIDVASVGDRRRLLDAAVAGLGALFAAALFLGLFDNGLPPKPARAEAAVAVAAAPSASGLCFHGPGGELLDFAPAGRRCP